MMSMSALLWVRCYCLIKFVRVPSFSLAEMPPDRNSAIIAADGSGAYSMKEIGDYFGLHYSRVSRIVRGARGKT